MHTITHSEMHSIANIFWAEASVLPTQHRKNNPETMTSERYREEKKIESNCKFKRGDGESKKNSEQ